MKIKYPIVCLLVVAAVAVFVSGASVSENENAAGTSAEKGVRAGFSPAKLFDFENYKTVFHKTYSGFLEEMVRAKYFLSRAFRAFVSAIKYKYRKSSYYLAVNDMSDWTPEEIDRSENKMLAESSYATRKKREAVLEVDKQARGGSQDDLPVLLPNNVDEVKRELKAIADSMEPGEPGYDELKVVMGETVATPSSGTQRANVRDLPMEMLINTGAGVHLNAETARKVAKDVESNNPAYKQLELPSFGLLDEQEDIRFWEAPILPRRSEQESFKYALSDTLVGIKFSNFDQNNQPIAEAKLPDEVFLDLRETNCFTAPRDQGHCGACWAFVTTSIFEWMYCKKMGKLVQFSEQYLIDCGKRYGKEINGCAGSNARKAAHFIKNFGLEMRATYPYNMQENECPYDANTNLNETGFIRFDFSDVLIIPPSEVARYLNDGPLFVGVATGPIFREYRGGVFGEGCPEKATHAVVLVGHGREDGEEYWLIRNSHGVGWGEGGYGKMAKKADCFRGYPAHRFAARFSKIQARIEHNKLYDNRIVKDRYEQKIFKQ